ncbi:MAG: hypothetical protein GX447_08070 [Elusimicrobia bacterium]|nr:hypothetical protein [Elusimicrobiota bacterium]
MIIILLVCVLFLSFSFLNLFLSSYSNINKINSFFSFLLSAAGLFACAAGLISQGSFLPFKSQFINNYFYFDYLSHFFLLIFYISLSAVSLYSAGYLKKTEGKKSLNFFWFNFYLLAFSMQAALISKNSVLFILFWELMAFSSFFLVMTDFHKKEVRKAGFIYMCANGAGALILIAAFSLYSDSYYNFSVSSYPSAVFFMTLIGFGLKAGFIPLHIWLPEAHPAAPGNISALMSGMMIKMGIYGILRTLSLLSPWKESWGWTILILGSLSAVLGIIFSLGQKELKKFLAYSSVENIGIILIALGLAILLNCNGYYELSVIALFASLFHIFNHSIFKNLLFMSAGAIAQSASTLIFEELGGLSKKMPYTAFLFFIGASAASGLPLFNGFAGEFLIYYVSFSSIGFKSGTFSVFAVLSVSLTGALALASFAKIFSALFHGGLKNENHSDIKDPSLYMLLPMGFLAFMSLLAGLIPYLPFKLLFSSFNFAFTQSSQWISVSKYLLMTTCSYCALIMFFLAFYYMRKRISKENETKEGITWDCGYGTSLPSAKYSAASFSQPITEFFSFDGQRSRSYPKILEYFPKSAFYSGNTRAVFYELFYAPAAKKIKKAASRLSFIQSGQLRFYILYIFLTLAALLIWKI